MGRPHLITVRAKTSQALQVEAARLCARAARPLDRPLLESAIRQSDLLLAHYADPARLVHR